MEKLLPVILAGGAGTRLTPLTSSALPKPFLPLATGGSLLSRTCARVAAPRFLPPILVGAASAREKLGQHARAGGVSPAAILLEPVGRNTALAIAVAAAYALRHRPHAVLAVLPCDHHIAPAARWRAALTQAAWAASETDRLCLLAIPATAPRLGLGYIQLAPGEHWCAVRRFVEKPAAPARLLAQGGNWAWNIGQFVASASCFARLFQQHLPALWHMAETAVARATLEEGTLLLDAASYKRAEALSFDHAIAEHAALIAVLPDIAWDDLGTPDAWKAHNRELMTNNI